MSDWHKIAYALCWKLGGRVEMGAEELKQAYSSPGTISADMGETDPDKLIVSIDDEQQGYAGDSNYPGERSSHPFFEEELRSLINSRSQEGASDTPDFILVRYLSDCLKAFSAATVARDDWYGRDDEE